MSGMSVVEAVQRDLAKMPGDAGGSGVAATALGVASEVDSDSSAASKKMCAKGLVGVMDRLLELGPPRGGSDGLDDLAARRARRVGGAAAKDSARS